MLDLKQQLMSWDGQVVADLEAIYDLCVFELDFTDQLLSLLPHIEAQNAAAWLIKHHCENGGIFKLSEIVKIYHHANKLVHWQAQLNILQAMPYLPIPASHKIKVERFLRHTLTSENKFVRAWSYSGFDLLAQEYPLYRDEADHFMELAMRDESASVKARIRQIQKDR